ncbi:MAG TPA: histidine phosphatase family protein [Ktedonobacteraceae bacterium]|nr:histidine phosphatase family protein [Ktedonobacteraceae bacterium]
MRMKYWLFLIRHGQTTWNVEHRLPGQVPGVELTDAGREQAKQLAQALKTVPLTAIISSPLERATETARYIAEGRNITIQMEPDLMDIELGRWTGQDRDELTRHDPVWQAFLRNPLIGPEGVETFPDVEHRAVTAVERWLQQEATGACPAFVTHSDVIKLLIAHYEGLEVRLARRLFIENASVSVIELQADHRPRIHAIGWTPQPFWLEPSTFAFEQPKREEQVDGEQYG